MAKALTILQFADRLEKIGGVKALNKSVLPPFKKNLKIMQRGIIDEYWSIRFGARIWDWAKKKFNNPKMGPSVKLGSKTRYARWSTSEQAYLGVITVPVYSMSFKMEEGGALRKHVVFGRKELPGQPVPRHHVVYRVIGRNWDRTVDEVSRSFWKFVEARL